MSRATPPETSASLLDRLVSPRGYVALAEEERQDQHLRVIPLAASMWRTTRPSNRARSASRADARKPPAVRTSGLLGQPAITKFRRIDRLAATPGPTTAAKECRLRAVATGVRVALAQP
jgi:hypothetical protein